MALQVCSQWAIWSRQYTLFAIIFVKSCGIYLFDVMILCDFEDGLVHLKKMTDEGFILNYMFMNTI